MAGRMGLFRDVIEPWAKRYGRAGSWLGRGVAKKGFTDLKSNVGYGFSALKGDPSTVMGMGELEAVGRLGRAIKPGNITALAPQMGRSLRRWGMGADLAGQGRLRGVGVASRLGAIGGGAATADFLNPWGLGWGD